MAVSLAIMVVILFKISSEMRKSAHLLQTDIHLLSSEMLRVLKSIDEFVRSDLHQVSQETTRLASQLNELSADINDKSHSLNCLFRPFRFLSDKLGKDSSSDESESPITTIPETIKWVGSSMSLIKTIKEFLKNHGKQK
jgi:uncharacterized protein YoxC